MNDDAHWYRTTSFLPNIFKIEVERKLYTINFVGKIKKEKEKRREKKRINNDIKKII